jgi:serine/threonine protein kinase
LPHDPIEHRRVVAEAEGMLFGEPPAEVTVGRFRIEAKLGEGGMGRVYGAYDPQLQRRVALKLLQAHVRETGSMLEEARAMARLSDPNVVTVHEVAEGDEGVFIVMEWIRGKTLRDWLDDPRPWQRVLATFVKAARGLAAAHDAGLVHRDFKPENVMVAGDRVVVTDFGLARTHRESSGSAGTPRYMAPEQREGGRVGPAADQYSFCVALYEALYGEPPSTPVKPPASTDTPQLVWRALRRGLADDPAARHPSMHVLLDALAPGPPRGRAWIRAGLAVLVVVLLTGTVLQMRVFWQAFYGG